MPLGAFGPHWWSELWLPSNGSATLLRYVRGTLAHDFSLPPDAEVTLDGVTDPASIGRPQVFTATAD
jgi:hypothetical protein